MFKSYILFFGCLILSVVCPKNILTAVVVNGGNLFKLTFLHNDCINFDSVTCYFRVLVDEDTTIDIDSLEDVDSSQSLRDNLWDVGSNASSPADSTSTNNSKLYQKPPPITVSCTKNIQKKPVSCIKNFH